MPRDFPYDLTAHAARVLKEREIPLEWVARILKRPERTETDRVDPEVRHVLARIPEHGGRVLRVIYNGTTTPWRIVTAYFDRKERSGS
nr:DUF4258 domain-containing protein [Nitrospirota bacterium]